jgi:DNA-binding LytR/AlgR family response regulator
MTLASGRVLLHLAGRIRRVVDADDVYSLEAQGDETDVRLGGEKPLRDVRSLGEVLRDLAPLGFVRIHRNHAVNPGRVREIRPAASGSSWEVRLQPPVNWVLPVSRRSLNGLLAAYRGVSGARARRATGPGRC